MSRDFPNPHFYHFATDIDGKRLISDAGPLDQRAKIYVAELGEPGHDPLKNWGLPAVPQVDLPEGGPIHPFLSPDGSMGFFNSDESGILQAYMIRGIDQALRG